MRINLAGFAERAFNARLAARVVPLARVADSIVNGGDDRSVSQRIAIVTFVVRVVSAAIAYLSAHANPAFALECPGNSFGHQAMTCSFVNGYCPGRQVIAITVPCPAAYMNEAENSWILLGLRSGSIDPYGSCP